VAGAQIKGGTTRLRDLRWGELIVLLPLLALIFYIGAAPVGLTTRMESSVQAADLRAAHPEAGVHRVTSDAVHGSISTLIIRR
jgi:hypothetical protein